MRIEDITELRLKKAKSGELKSLRSRISQLYEKHFHGNSKEMINTELTGKLIRKDFLKKYKILTREMNSRKCFILKKTPIDLAIFKQAFLGVDSASLGEIAIVNDYVSIGGSYMKDPKKANDVDVIIRDFEKNKDEGLELEIAEIVKKEIKKEPHFIYVPKRLNDSYIPIFDLVLRPKEETKQIEAKTDIPDVINVKQWLTAKQRKELEEENEKIKENEKKPEAKEPHEYKQAKFTHPNGHPRCLICGDEEPIGKVCNMVKSWYSKYEWDDDKSWDKERDRLKEKGIIKFIIEKPEETEDYIRIPVSPECEVTATIDLDKAKGITALYCGKIKKVRTVIFSKDKGWTMAKAKKWVKDHKDSLSKYVEKAEEKLLNIDIKKLDKKEYIVGGVVVVSGAVDTQGHIIQKGEVWNALKSWMLKGGKIKVMHGGFPVDIKVVECYQADETHHKGGASEEHLVNKGDWWISLYLGSTKKSKELFQEVVDGKFNAFSIGGTATV